MNIDGSNLKKIPLTLPSGLTTSGNAHLSSDGKTIVFSVTDATFQSAIYSCNVDGSNPKKLIDGAWNILDVR